MGLRDLTLGAAILAASFVALRHPLFGILAYISYSILNPHSYAWRLTEFVRPAYPLAAATILGSLVSHDVKRLSWGREHVLLIGIWAAFALSSIFAINPALAHAKLVSVSKILFMALLSTALLHTRSHLHQALRIVALSLGALALKAAFFALLTAGQYIFWGPEDSYLYANNAIGLAFAVNAAILFHLASSDSNRWLRTIFLFMFIATYPATLVTYSRGAWLALGAVTVVITLRRPAILVGGAVGSLCVMLLFGSVSQLVPSRAIHRFQQLLDYQQDGSAQARFWSWELCRRVGLANPATGAGFDFYSIDIYRLYLPEFFSPLLDLRAWSCHSSWWTVFAEHGVPGVVLYAVLLTTSIVSLIRLAKEASRVPMLAWAKPYAQMLTEALIAYSVGGIFLDVAYFEIFYQLIAFAAILRKLVRPVPPPSAVPLPRAVTSALRQSSRPQARR